VLRTRSVELEDIQPPATHSRRRTSHLVLKQAANGHGYEIVTGHHIYEAAVRAGVRRVFCLTRELDPEDPLDRLAEIRGIGGRDPIEEAEAIEAAISATGLSQRDLAAMVGMTQSHVSKRLSLLRLSPRDISRLRKGVITLDEARELCRIRAPRPHRPMHLPRTTSPMSLLPGQ
jgi:ParB-like chromosome segregation protein Spo0J